MKNSLDLLYLIYTVNKTNDINRIYAYNKIS